MSKRGVIFAMGSPHSGTTLLTLLLGSHSRAVALGEMKGLPNVLGKLPEGAASCCFVCRGPCPVWDRAIAESFVARRFGDSPGLRDPRATVNSWRRKYPETPIADWAERWVRDVRSVEAVFEGFDPARRRHVRYEDLAADPEAAPAQDREAFYAGMSSRISIDERWRVEMSAEDLAVFDRIAAAANRPYAWEPSRATQAAGRA